jgi:hypothetical protein
MTATTPAGQAAAQSLAGGAAGTALPHIERALNGAGTWDDARAAISRITEEPVDASPEGALFHGVPALAFVLHTAAADGRPRYHSAAWVIRRHVHRITQQRLTAADERIRRGVPGTFAEYDLFYGLTGLAALLLRTDPGSDTLSGVLHYLVTLTRPLVIDGLDVPGWWADHDPDPLRPTPGGHANQGMAHGGAGILAALSLATIHGHTVPGQHAAVEYLRDWFGQWQQDNEDGPWWPECLTRDELRTGRPNQQRPGRSSWCYGTAGIARALQLAAIATGDMPRQSAAEHAFAACLTASRLASLTEPGLCHGFAGLYQTAVRVSRDALTPAIASRLPDLAAMLAVHADDVTEPGLLTGTDGVRLALETARTGAPPRSGWDSCLLLA